MDLELYQNLETLKKLIKVSKEYKELEESENELNSIDIIKVLSYKKDIAILEYEDAVKYFGKNSKEAFKCRKKLKIAINELNNHPVVIEYKEKYEILNSMLLEINSELFNELIN